ncbi:type I-E CRISPR-associated protein Cse2/CasB [Nonomuraea sp. NPDC001699]
MISAPSSNRRAVADLVAEIAEEYISELQRGYLAERSQAVATLAQLRRGAGKLPEEVPELWGMAGTERLYAEQELSSRESEMAEAGLFLAVTLYALHQQSRPKQGMHRSGVELGAAVRRLMPGGALDEPIRRRFVRVGTAGTRQALAYRLREVITLLRGQSIPLDYALLAQQLYRAQLPDGMRQVRQRWGRSFHAYRPADQPSDTSPVHPASPEKDS